MVGKRLCDIEQRIQLERNEPNDETIAQMFNFAGNMDPDWSRILIVSYKAVNTQMSCCFYPRDWQVGSTIRYTFYQVS